jgi:hypothetical protein
MQFSCRDLTCCEQRAQDDLEAGRSGSSVKGVGASSSFGSHAVHGAVALEHPRPRRVILAPAPPVMGRVPHSAGLRLRAMRGRAQAPRSEPRALILRPAEQPRSADLTGGAAAAPAAAPNFTLPGFYGAAPTSFTGGEGRLSRPRVRYNFSTSTGYDDNVFQTQQIRLALQIKLWRLWWTQGRRIR